MLTRRASKFCAKPRSPFSEIYHQESKTIGKPQNIVSWPECRPEFPSDGDDGGGGDGFPRTLSIWLSPGSITPRNQISCSGNPSLRCWTICVGSPAKRFDRHDLLSVACLPLRAIEICPFATSSKLCLLYTSPSPRDRG